MAAHGICPIDLVVVNLYAFSATVAKGGDFDTCIENIDIGGPSMIRRCGGGVGCGICVFVRCATRRQSTAVPAFGWLHRSAPN
jgi:hypothetical protein